MQLPQVTDSVCLHHWSQLQNAEEEKQPTVKTVGYYGHQKTPVEHILPLGPILNQFD
jgi:hypothetical protein